MKQFKKINDIYVIYEIVDDGSAVANFSVHYQAHKEKLDGYLTEAKDSGLLNHYSTSAQNVVVVVMPRYNQSFLEDLTQYFNTEGMLQVCSDSGTSDHIGLYRHDGEYYVLSQDVVYSQGSNESAIDANPIKQVLPFIGALGGIIVGMVLWILVGKIGFIVGFVGYVVVYLGFKGFELFGGTLTKTTIFVITGLALVGILASEYIPYVMQAQELGFDLSQSLKIAYRFIVQNGDVLASFLISSGMGIIFTLLASKQCIEQAYTKASGAVTQIYYADYQRVG